MQARLAESAISVSTFDFSETGALAEESGVCEHSSESLIATEPVFECCRRSLRSLTAFLFGPRATQVLDLIAGSPMIRWLGMGDDTARSLVARFQGAAGVLIGPDLEGYEFGAWTCSAPEGCSGSLQNR